MGSDVDGWSGVEVEPKVEAAVIAGVRVVDVWGVIVVGLDDDGWSGDVVELEGADDDRAGVVADIETDVWVGSARVDEGKVETDDEACVVIVTESEDKDCAVDCDVEVNVWGDAVMGSDVDGWSGGVVEPKVEAAVRDGVVVVCSIDVDAEDNAVNSSVEVGVWCR